MSRSREDTLGARVGGGILVAHAALSLTAVLAGHPLGPLPRWVALADLALGASLLTGHGWRLLVIIRCLLGVVVLTNLTVDGGGVHVLDGDWLELAAQLAFAAGMIALLVGDAAPRRIVAGVLLAAPLLAGALLSVCVGG